MPEASRLDSLYCVSMLQDLIEKQHTQVDKKPQLDRIRPAFYVESGCSLVVKLQPSKLAMWVRFPSPAPFPINDSFEVESLIVTLNKNACRNFSIRRRSCSNGKLLLNFNFYASLTCQSFQKSDNFLFFRRTKSLLASCIAHQINSLF